MNPIEMGRLVPFSETVAWLREAIVAKVAAENYPKSFIHYIDAHEKYVQPGEKCLVLPAGSELGNSVRLDWDEPWVRQNRVTALACEGDLKVAGDLLNLNINAGPLLFVAGNLSVINLVNGGAIFIVLGDLKATGVVVGEYNDGVSKINGDLHAQLVINLDHDIGVVGQIAAPVVDWNEDELSEQLVPEVFNEDDDCEVVVEQVLERQRAGLPILLARSSA